MSIEWRPQMSVDGGVIDADHRHLIDIINRFDRIAANGLTLDEALEILFALKFYAATHFDREERLQKLSLYPYHDSHAREHAELLAKLEAIVDDLKAAGERPLDEVATETGDLLREWLIHHVLESDLRMKPYVEAMKKEAEAMGALADVELQ